MLRSAAIVALFASLTLPAQAMDPSATEETNCLMACDANQQNCASGHASSHSAGAPKLLQAPRRSANFTPRPKDGQRPSGRTE